MIRTNDLIDWLFPIYTQKALPAFTPKGTFCISFLFVNPYGEKPQQDVAVSVTISFGATSYNNRLK